MNPVKPAITQQTIAQLIELHDRHRLEAGHCADMGAFTAATVMMSSAFEAQLFCTVGMAEHELRPADLWPGGEPSKWSLGTLVKVANDADWFEAFDEGFGDLVEAVTFIRNCCVHPAAYVREGGQPITEDHFVAIFGTLLAADEALGRVIEQLPDPPR